MEKSQPILVKPPPEHKKDKKEKPLLNLEMKSTVPVKKIDLAPKL